ncbi:hypothetical protein LWI28_026216 [Acer negundo]|uniref:Uncharacterized protein n=1 Tax=Acer negundo TaxID=4023 RepID=A0AAD5NGB7_ACENE|nr:hypothetical protein LWI28_026216 [Acer negundo]
MCEQRKVYHYLGELKEVSKEVVICNIYVPNLEDERVAMWDSGEAASLAKLNRFLISPNILLWFSDLLQRNLPKSIFDHSTVRLDINKEGWWPYPFRYFNSWSDDKSLMDLVSEEWTKKKVTGNARCCMTFKIRAVKNVFKRWQKKVKSEDKSLEWLEAKLKPF